MPSDGRKKFGMVGRTGGGRRLRFAHQSAQPSQKCGSNAVSRCMALMMSSQESPRRLLETGPVNKDGW